MQDFEQEEAGGFSEIHRGGINIKITIDPGDQVYIDKIKGFGKFTGSSKYTSKSTGNVFTALHWKIPCRTCGDTFEATTIYSKEHKSFTYGLNVVNCKKHKGDRELKANKKKLLDKEVKLKQPDQSNFSDQENTILPNGKLSLGFVPGYKLKSIFGHLFYFLGYREDGKMTWESQCKKCDDSFQIVLPGSKHPGNTAKHLKRVHCDKHKSKIWRAY